jgi:uridine phosphorylase
MPFPNMKGKHGCDSLITAKDFLRYINRVGKGYKFKAPEGVILCYKRSFLDYIIANHKVEKMEGFQGEFYLLKETRGQIGAGRCGIGAPVMAIAMEELIAMGVKKFLSVGEAGSLQKDLKVGDIIVCDRAIRDEGTSHHYIKPSKYAYPSKELTKRIIENLEKNGLKYSVGTTWTIDTPYRETIEEVKKYQKEGVLAVEMEASAIFAVAEHKKVQAGSILTVSDYLGELKWKPKFERTQGHLERIFQVSKEILMAE